MRTKLIAATPVLAAVLAGLVYAAWTTGGGGAGYQRAGHAEPLGAVAASASTSATLYPGAPAGDVVIKVNNPNSYPVTVSAVASNGPITADAEHGGCTTSGVSFVDQTGLSISVPAGGETHATLEGAASMSNDSLDACQGATFTIPVRLTGASG